MARRLALTEEVRLTILAALRNGNHRVTSCRLAGIHRDTLDGWMQRAKAGEEPFADFAAEVEAAEAEHESAMLKEIRSAQPAITGVSGAEPWMNKAWILERRYPTRWSARVRHHVTEELSQLLGKLESKLTPETFAEVVNASREDAVGEGADDPRH